MMKKIVITLLLFCFYTTHAQITAITEKGDTILVFENGTWSESKTLETVTPIVSNVKVDVEVDEFSGDKKCTTKRWYKFGINNLKYTISGWLFKKTDVIVFYIQYSDELGCFSQARSKMLVKLTNGEVIEFTQITDTECGENEIVGFIPVSKDEMKEGDYKELMKERIKTLKEYDWETIRLHGTEYYTDIKPNTTNSIDNPEQFFRQHIIAIESN